MGLIGLDGGIVILNSCEHHNIKVHENLLQQPSNNISIGTAKLILFSVAAARLLIKLSLFCNIVVSKNILGQM